MTISALSYGGGVNSTALLCLSVRLGWPPSVVLFADTGGERPETYAHVALVEAWAAERGIRFVRVSNASPERGASLEENCLRRHELPSLAYGFKGCSVKWKRQPMDRWIRDEWPEAREAWERGELVERWIGIDAGEQHRANLTADKRHRYRYPLIEHGLDREACEREISAAGLPVPPKSSCFFCPATRKHEIMDLAKKHPDLLKRALAIEANAETHTVKGLGRSWSWLDYLKRETAQGKLFPEAPELPCGCHDQGDE